MYFSRNFYKATRNTNSSWLVFSHCRPLSTQDCELILSVFLTAPGLYLNRLVSSAVRCRLPFCVTLRQLLSLGSFFQLPYLAFPFPLPVSSKISSINPLSDFAPKQTKGSSAWRTTYIVSQFVYCWLCFRVYMYFVVVCGSTTIKKDTKWSTERHLEEGSEKQKFFCFLSNYIKTAESLY